jgi:large subunit ribosomal protein L15
MKLNNLKYTKGSRRQTKSYARGFGSGHGKTAGRGQKGQKSRNGGGVRMGFTGGTFSLLRNLPKFGFSNAEFRNKYNVVTLKEVLLIEENLVDKKALEAYRIIKKNNLPIKVISSKVEIKKPITLKVNKISNGAKLLIEQNGGKVEII